MSEPIPQSSTFAEDLAFTLMDSFAAAYYVCATDTQRKAVLKGASQLIDCRLKQILHEAQSVRPNL